MTKFFADTLLLSQSDEQVTLSLQISPDIAYFAGHFPGAPVLAGVTQLHWVVDYARRYFPDLAAVHSVEVLKFQRMIRPGDQLTLQLQRTASTTVLFSYHNAEQKVASGRLKWQLQQEPALS